MFYSWIVGNLKFKFMKKNLLLLLLLCIISLSRAQETTIEPGQQAKNYLNSKNASVDYATGIFCYKVPVHEIKVGDFTLPITLDYAARGVKADDKPGAVGYNWNLNVGGIVTRQLRGGIADEIPGKGAAYYLGRLEGSYAQVNMRDLDGESDIFTAVFNGRNINFIIRYQEGIYPYFFTVPLEPTNVKIECIVEGNSTISGWKITDEMGNRYVFQDKEWSLNTREGTVETNSIVDGNYVSSWYLSRVFPINGFQIDYEYYQVGEPGLWTRDTILLQNYFFRTTVIHYYGQPMIERPFDLDKYKPDLERELQYVGSYFDLQTPPYPGGLSYLEQIRRSSLYTTLDDYYRSGTYYYSILSRIASNLKTIGILYNHADVNRACQEIIYVLDEIVSRCNSQLSGYAQTQAIYHLNQAKNIVKQCRDEIKGITQKEVYQYGAQEVKSPLIKTIASNNNVIEFKYIKTYVENFLLDKINVRDMNNSLIKSIHVYRISPYESLPSEISFHDKFDVKISNIKFDYYDFFTSKLVTNIYGYYEEYQGYETDHVYKNKQRFFCGFDKNTLYKSLKTIKISNDAEIELKYGCNTSNISIKDFNEPHLSGGICIREVSVNDKSRGRTDKIEYFYALGTSVYPVRTNLLTINYPKGFKDVMRFDRLYNPRPDAYVKSGNNGVYYSHVSEVIEGKGRVERYFEVPDTSYLTFNYWNIGNPLGTCYYDDDGELRKVVRYEYDDTLALANKKLLDQVKPCEYFVDAGELISRYMSKDSIYFVDNMRDRLAPIIFPPDQQYKIVYDYTSYLKRVTEFNFEENPEGNNPDYLKVSPNYLQTEYDYDLSKSMFPVRTTKTSGDGIKYIEIVKRALDFEDTVAPCIPLLKACNMVGVPLKVQSRVVASNGVEQLLSEQVNEYESFRSNFPCMLLTGTSEYVHDGEAVEQMDSLFGFAQNLYEKMTFTYEQKQNRWLPASMEYQGVRERICYDFTMGIPILKASFVPVNTVVAQDYRRFKGAYGRPSFELLNAPSLRYKLFVLTDRTVVGCVVLSVVHGGGTVTREFTTRANYSGPQVFDLDLTTVTGITKINLSSPSGELVYIALVPTDSEFEAKSYNADGTVYCNFDHNGQALIYEYDTAGRVSKVIDQEGNLLKECSYNKVIL